MSKSQMKRLYISPLTPELLPVALGSVVTVAQDISYHELQAFPDKSYGYLALPDMEAEKVKKKLNGALLKGKKMSVEDARPKKRRHETIDEAQQGEAEAIPKKKTRRNKDSEVLPGHELSPDRQIKRGWTEQKMSKRKEGKAGATAERPASKSTSKEELLFRTRLPDNKADMASSKKKKSRKSKESHTVHEFEKTVTQPTFLKSEEGSSSTTNLVYVDGQGWVGTNGDVVEKEPQNLRNRRKSKKSNKSNTVSNTKSEATEQRKEAEALRPDHAVEFEQIDPSMQDADSARSEEQTSESVPSPESYDDSVQPAALQLHPLEALFKKPQKPASSQDVVKPSLEVQTGFSFFGGAANDDLEEEVDMPGTPHGSQDVRSRGMRSAAPTPDTAHPSRFNSYGSSGLPGDEDIDTSDEDGEEAKEQKTSGLGLSIKTNAESDQQKSDFEKAFWEKRGDNNRSWKARRRTVLKEQRQRENRARRPKNW